jgi:hypothetical protein
MFAAIYHTEDGDELFYWSENCEAVEARVYYLNKYAPQTRYGELIETTVEQLMERFPYCRDALVSAPDLAKDINNDPPF